MIESPLLPQLKGYVAGRWAGADVGRTLTVINPATGEHLADVPDMAGAETTAAIEAAAAALRAEYSLEQRRLWLDAIAAALLENKAELARIITLEQGKPLAESAAEIVYAAGFFQFFAAQIDWLKTETIEESIRNCRWQIHHRPAGVAALITPWNFPLAMLAKKLAPALAAGCSVVVKPADLTPLTSIALWTLLQDLELPTGKMNLIIGRPAPIGEVLCAHPAVRLISFTGSTATGKLLIRNTAPYIKRLALELGGNAPFIVFEDADVEAAADALIANKFRCAGQTCVCANRVYVQRAIAARFTAAVVERVARLQIGNGLEPGIDLGPLINRAAFDKVARHIADALARGAQRIFGTEPPRPDHDWGCFYPPAVLTGAQPEMLMSREETFGPVIAISDFASEDEVVGAANGTPYGLAAYVFTRDETRAQRIISRLDCGHIGLNSGTGPTPEAPFGGLKQSGFGREGGSEGLSEFCETQTVARSEE